MPKQTNKLRHRSAPTTFSNEYFRLLIEAEWTRKNWKGPVQYENKDGGDLMMLASVRGFG